MLVQNIPIVVLVLEKEPERKRQSVSAADGDLGKDIKVSEINGSTGGDVIILKVAEEYAAGLNGEITAEAAAGLEQKLKKKCVDGHAGEHSDDSGLSGMATLGKAIPDHELSVKIAMELPSRTLFALRCLDKAWNTLLHRPSFWALRERESRWAGAILDWYETDSDEEDYHQARHADAMKELGRVVEQKEGPWLLMASYIDNACSDASSPSSSSLPSFQHYRLSADHAHCLAAHGRKLRLTAFSNARQRWFPVPVNHNLFPLMGQGFSHLTSRVPATPSPALAIASLHIASAGGFICAVIMIPHDASAHDVASLLPSLMPRPRGPSCDRPQFNGYTCDPQDDPADARLFHFLVFNILTGEAYRIPRPPAFVAPNLASFSITMKGDDPDYTIRLHRLNSRGNWQLAAFFSNCGSIAYPYGWVLPPDINTARLSEWGADDFFCEAIINRRVCLASLDLQMNRWTKTIISKPLPFILHCPSYFILNYQEDLLLVAGLSQKTLEDLDRSSTSITSLQEHQDRADHVRGFGVWKMQSLHLRASYWEPVAFTPAHLWLVKSPLEIGPISQLGIRFLRRGDCLYMTGVSHLTGEPQLHFWKPLGYNWRQSSWFILPSTDDGADFVGACVLQPLFLS